MKVTDMSKDEFIARWNTKGSKTRAHFNKYPYLADNFYEFKDRYSDPFIEAFVPNLTSARESLARKPKKTAHNEFLVYAGRLHKVMQMYGAITMSTYDIQESLLWVADEGIIELDEALEWFNSVHAVGPFKNGRSMSDLFK